MKNIFVNFSFPICIGKAFNRWMMSDSSGFAFMSFQIIAKYFSIASIFDVNCARISINLSIELRDDFN